MFRDLFSAVKPQDEGDAIAAFHSRPFVGGDQWGEPVAGDDVRIGPVFEQDYNYIFMAVGDSQVQGHGAAGVHVIDSRAVLDQQGRRIRLTLNGCPVQNRVRKLLGIDIGPMADQQV